MAIRDEVLIVQAEGVFFGEIVPLFCEAIGQRPDLGIGGRNVVPKHRAARTRSADFERQPFGAHQK